MRHTNRPTTSLTGLLFVLATGMSAYADTFTFNFTGLTEGQNTSQTQISVQNYMNGILGAKGSVTESHGITDNGYTADGHVVSSSFLQPSYTLATQDGGTFLVNDNLNSGFDDIKFVFNLTGGAKISSVSFDYEIFPDINCPSPENCSATPDIELSDGITTQFSKTGIEPGDPGGSTYKGSPANPFWWSTPEEGPQLLGSASVTGLSTLTLDFIDWPATIGINNVQITTTGGGGLGSSSSVPEPTSIVLLGTIVSLVMFKFRRRQQV